MGALMSTAGSCTCCSQKTDDDPRGRKSRSPNTEQEKFHHSFLSSSPTIATATNTCIALQPPAIFDDLVMFTLDQTKPICDGSLRISDCQQSHRLIKILNRYNEIMLRSQNPSTFSFSSKLEKEDDLFLQQCIQHMTNTLNDFHHILFDHYSQSNEEHFEYIHHQLTSCDIEHCVSVPRHYRDKHRYKDKYFQLTQLYFPFSVYDEVNDVDNLYVYQLMDRMHCHLYHSFDVGYKLFSNQQSTDISPLREIFSSKYKIRGTVSDIQQRTQSTENHRIPRYSCSYPFLYWNYYKNIDKLFVGNLSFSSLCVPQKYRSLKQELLYNEVYSIDVDHWKVEMKKAIELHSTTYCKQSIKPLVSKYMRSIIDEPEHISNYGYTDYSTITINHLLSVAVFSSFPKLKQAFSATFHAQNETSNAEDDEKEPQSLFERIKQKHSNYHFLAKYLKETVCIFGQVFMHGKIEKMYQNLPRKVFFDSTQQNIYGILSTTSSFVVAMSKCVAFQDGMIVEMVPDANLKYFQCSWLSSYSNQEECIFFSGTHPIRLVNIMLVPSGSALNEQIKAMHIVDSMSNGDFFSDDSTVHFKLARMNTGRISKLGVHGLPQTVKNMTVKLIQHELNRYDGGKYEKWTDLHAYIDTWFHHLCTMKQKVTIDVETMRTEIRTDFYRGYIGYLFLKEWIFVNGMPENGVDYQFIYMLFPNVKQIYVVNSDCASALVLDNLLSFLEMLNKRKNGLRAIQLALAKQSESETYSVLMEEVRKRESKFQNLQFQVSITKNRDGQKALFLEKIETSYPKDRNVCIL